MPSREGRIGDKAICGHNDTVNFYFHFVEFQLECTFFFRGRQSPRVLELFVVALVAKATLWPGFPDFLFLVVASDFFV
jgi:hypothetical protein